MIIQFTKLYVWEVVGISISNWRWKLEMQIYMLGNNSWRILTRETRCRLKLSGILKKYIRCCLLFWRNSEWKSFSYIACYLNYFEDFDGSRIVLFTIFVYLFIHSITIQILKECPDFNLIQIGTKLKIFSEI